MHSSERFAAGDYVGLFMDTRYTMRLSDRSSWFALSRKLGPAISIMEIIIIALDHAPVV